MKNRLNIKNNQYNTNSNDITYSVGIDRLSGTITFPDSVRELASKNLNEYVNKESSKIYRQGKTKIYQSYVKIDMRLVDQAEDHMFVFVFFDKNQNSKTTVADYKIEANPKYHGKDAILSIRKILCRLFGKKAARHFYNVFTITRLDFYVDFLGIPMENMFIQTSRAQSYQYIRSSSGELEYVRFGGKKCNQFVLYDKAREINDRRKKKKLPLINFCEGRFSYVPYIRLEFRIKERRKLWALTTLNSPFTKFSLIDPSITTHKRIHPWFIHAAKALGITNAVNKLSPKNRDKYVGVVKTYSIDIDHKSIWSNIIKSLECLNKLKHPETYEAFQSESSDKFQPKAVPKSKKVSSMQNRRKSSTKRCNVRKKRKEADAKAKRREDRKSKQTKRVQLSSKGFFKENLL